MKRIILVLLTFLLGLELSGQSNFPNFGKRLTIWCNSDDVRMLTAIDILRNKYPNSENLIRKVDNLENSKEDTEYILLSLYKGYGPDWAYASLHDYFTPKEIERIEQIYTANGGIILTERTENERKQESNKALKRGITTDMAERLYRFCYGNKDFFSYVRNILIKRDISPMGCYRIVDNFSNNLDYVEEVFFTLYDNSGPDKAYYVLRRFLTSEQINALDSIYEGWKAIQHNKKMQEENQRQIELNRIIDSIHNIEPITVSEFSSYEYSRIKDILFSDIVNCTKDYQIDNYSISLSDDVLVDPDGGTSHTLSIVTNPQDNAIVEKIKTTIESIPFGNLFYKISAFNYEFPIKYKDHFDIQYDYRTEEKDLVVTFKRWDNSIVLKEGDAEFFQLHQEKIKKEIVKRGKYGRNKIKVKNHFENDKPVLIEIIPL